MIQKSCECGFFRFTQLIFLFIKDSFEIPINSELRTIEKEAFANTSIENFTIPPSLVDLRNGWFCGLRLLKSIDASSENPRYKINDNKFIIGK